MTPEQEKLLSAVADRLHAMEKDWEDLMLREAANRVEDRERSNRLREEGIRLSLASNALVPLIHLNSSTAVPLAVGFADALIKRVRETA